MVRFFTSVVPGLLAERLETFREYADLLTEFTINQGLNDNDLPGPARQAIYRAFYRELKGWDEEPAERVFDPEEGE